MLGNILERNKVVVKANVHIRNGSYSISPKTTRQFDTASVSAANNLYQMYSHYITSVSTLVPTIYH